MSASFFFIVAVSLIFRFFSVQAEKAGSARLRALLPRRLLAPTLADLVREFPERLPAYREQVLPMHARSLAFNAVACGTFLAGLWIAPPAFLGGFDLGLLRFTGLGIVLVALAADLNAFSRLSRTCRAPLEAEEWADSEG